MRADSVDAMLELSISLRGGVSLLPPDDQIHFEQLEDRAQPRNEEKVILWHF